MGGMVRTLRSMDKAELRRSLLDHPVDWVALSPLVAGGLYHWLAGRLPGTVASFLAMADEVDLSTLTGRLPGWRWAYPRIEDDLRLTFRDRDVGIETHRWGMRQPIASGPEIPLAGIDVLLVPGVAFTQTGDRLGRGKGFYDRLLAERGPSSTAIGVTVRARVLDSLPVESHDAVVDRLATEDGVSRCTPSP